MIIKVLGPGCSKCVEAYEIVSKADWRRMLLAAYLELPEPEHIPYLRLLAASRRGCDLLRQMRGAPVLTKPADVSRLGQTAQDLFTREAGWTDLYTLAYPDLSQSACGADWRATPWIM